MMWGSRNLRTDQLSLRHAGLHAGEGHDLRLAEPRGGRPRTPVGWHLEEISSQAGKNQLRFRHGFEEACHARGVRLRIDEDKGGVARGFMPIVSDVMNTLGAA